MTMDEAAIVHTMRRALNDAYNSAHILKVWLQNENPLGLKGPELSDWATEISEWVLPTQMRTHHATATRQLTEGDRQQHQDGEGSREATEASGGHSFTRQQDERPFITQSP